MFSSTEFVFTRKIIVNLKFNAIVFTIRQYSRFDKAAIIALGEINLILKIIIII